ncbi:hypothetical protein [Streptomyces violascens]|uniref:hypothetical protein n=1 Tax=Streptomyces violascens TaxID=67381 RepID=UPI0016742E4C|nr:hypothetical protein [Streptomyces violascens]GGU49413.1 hypothetical protein GCM10010289_82410 [Streptomyces violascens]
MPTSLAAGPNAPAPTARQRTWLFAALRADDRLMPLGVPHRSLDLMRERGWLQFAPATDDDPLRARHVLTAAGRFALLSVGKADALLSVLTSSEPGRIERPVQQQILTSLLREGLVCRLSRRGEQGEDQEQFTYISNLGRRLVGLPEVDTTPASDYLVAAFAAQGITVAVESDSVGDTRVVYRLGDLEARFFREVWNPGHWTYSARHPSWMHDKPWTALITYSADGAVEKHLPNGLGVKEESVRLAAALTAWLTDRDDAAFAA